MNFKNYYDNLQLDCGLSGVKMIYRDITPELVSYSKQFPVVGVMGPRQSGKTTLVKDTFKNYHYASLENLDTRLQAIEDPRLFLSNLNNKDGLIIDEIQEAPELLSYMQGIVDLEYKPGFFIITGSQHFLLYEKISQTLAGRIGLLTLLPLSVNELKQANLLPNSIDDLIVKGFYPRPYVQNINFQAWQDSYIATYIEKDVRQVINIENLLAFQRFLKLLAARTGNLLNYADLSRDTDVSPNTVKAWLSVLHTGFIAHLLPPYFSNFNKRIIKTPKIYFYDTGLICFLLNIKTGHDLSIHPMRGQIFETFVINEIIKYFYANAQRANIYFWQDIQGHEIDCIIEKSVTDLLSIEIKSGMTINADFFKNLISWQELTKQSPENSYLVYSGIENQIRKYGQVISWQDIKQIVQDALK